MITGSQYSLWSTYIVLFRDTAAISQQKPIHVKKLNFQHPTKSYHSNTENIATAIRNGTNSLHATKHTSLLFGDADEEWRSTDWNALTASIKNI